MEPTRWFSPAKINLGLFISRQREDGYHEISTVFQEVDVGDWLRVSPADKGCQISASGIKVPGDESNLIWQAWNLMQTRYSAVRGLRVELEKNIPPGAGLGGGSSNAAVTLMAVNDLYDLNLSPSRLEALGAELGADVPFFIRGGTQLGEGIGERLTPLSRPLPGVLVLVLPPVAVNTAWAYSQVKTVWTNPRPQPNFAGVFQDEKFAYTIFENDFERIVIPAYPEIGRIKQGLIQAGAVFASLSGSGSTVYGIFNDEASARKAELTLRPHGRTLLAHPVHRHPDL